MEASLEFCGGGFPGCIIAVQQLSCRLSSLQLQVQPEGRTTMGFVVQASSLQLLGAA